MATKLIMLSVDERYPDFFFDEKDGWESKFALEVSITEEEYKEFKEIVEKYDMMQQYLEILYDKARKYAKANKKANC